MRRVFRGIRKAVTWGRMVVATVAGLILWWLRIQSVVAPTLSPTSITEQNSSGDTLVEFMFKNTSWLFELSKVRVIANLIEGRTANDSRISNANLELEGPYVTDVARRGSIRIALSDFVLAGGGVTQLKVSNPPKVRPIGFTAPFTGADICFKIIYGTIGFYRSNDQHFRFGHHQRTNWFRYRLHQVTPGMYEWKSGNACPEKPSE